MMIRSILSFALLIASMMCQDAVGKSIIHDAEFYLVEAQNEEAWKAEDAEIDARLAALREKHGTPPNIIHIMWDDTAFGDIGIEPANVAL